MKKDILKQVWDRAFDDLDENGDNIVKSRKIKTDQAVSVARANRLTKKTKESIEVQTKKNRKLAQDPNWLEKNSKKNKKLSRSNDWLQATQSGSNKRKDKGAALIAQGREDEFRKLFGIKDQHTEKTKKKMSESAKQRWAKKMKPLYCEGKKYVNIYAASEALGIHKDTVSYRIKTKPKEYYYID